MQEPPSEKAAPEPEECGVCLDANVEVEIDNCHHKLCCECAKAICCLEVSCCSQNVAFSQALSKVLGEVEPCGRLKLQTDFTCIRKKLAKR